jgi:hypothetical protein
MIIRSKNSQKDSRPPLIENENQNQNQNQNENQKEN